ncbi:MAG: PQQ-binding-like beta-propeller repeat protein [candidate division NC10 bacterium]
MRFQTVVALIAGLIFVAAAIWVVPPRATEEPFLMVPLTDPVLLEPLFYDLKLAPSGATVALAGSLGYEGRVLVFSFDGELEETFAKDIAVNYPQCCTNPPLVLSRDGGLLVGGSQEMVMWSPTVPAINISQQALNGRTPVALAMDDAGRTLAAVSSDRKLNVFDLTEGRRLWSVPLGQGWWADVDVTPQGRIALNSGSGLWVFDSASPEPLASWQLEVGYVLPAVAISPDGTVVGATEGAYQEGWILYMTVGEKGPLWTFPLGNGGSPLLAISPEGGLLVIEQSEGLILALGSDGAPLWRVELGERVRDAEFLEDGGMLIALEESVIVVRDGRTVARLQVEGRPLAVSSNGRTVALVHSPNGSYRSAMYLRLYTVHREDVELAGGFAISQAPMSLNLPTGQFKRLLLHLGT